MADENENAALICGLRFNVGETEKQHKAEKENPEKSMKEPFELSCTGSAQGMHESKVMDLKRLESVVH